MRFLCSSSTSKQLAPKCRGYVLSLDALLGVIVVAAALGLAGFLAQQGTSIHEEAAPAELMDDAFALLDDADFLKTTDQNIISAELGGIMPVQYGWRVRIEQYSYTYADDNFALENTIDFNSSFNTAADAIHGRRFFITYSGGEVHRFNNLEYWVGLRELGT